MKNIFKEYVDACMLEQELEERIKKIEEKTTVSDVVSGSSQTYPYLERAIYISEEKIRKDDREFEWEKLRRQKDNVRRIKKRCEEVMDTAPLRIQRIIQYKYIDNLTWQQVAKHFGNTSAESLKKEFQRFLKNK